jgi:hypothetical protein
MAAWFLFLSLSEAVTIMQFGTVYKTVYKKG